MPIEIRELIIKTQITEDDELKERITDPHLQAEKDRQLIERCVTEVMKKLKRRIER